MSDYLSHLARLTHLRLLVSPTDREAQTRVIENALRDVHARTAEGERVGLRVSTDRIAEALGLVDRDDKGRIVKVASVDECLDEIRALRERPAEAERIVGAARDRLTALASNMAISQFAEDEMASALEMP